jgi:hypothetical protein
VTVIHNHWLSAPPRKRNAGKGEPKDKGISCSDPLIELIDVCLGF